jgi:hypothetical protein
MLLEDINSKSFLGEEFLTWLLWKSEENSGLIGIGDLEVHFGGALTLAAPFGEAEEIALKGENPAGAPELLSGLREGKLLAKAQMRWIVDGIEWLFAVKGATLDMAGLKPPLKSAPPDPEWIERRLELMEEFAKVYDRVYTAFLVIRLSDSGWKKETQAMREWIAGDSPAAPSRQPEIIELHDEDEA